MASRLDDREALENSLMALHLMLKDPAHVEVRLGVAYEIIEAPPDSATSTSTSVAAVADLMELADVAAADTAMAECERALPRLHQPLLRLLPVQHHAMRVI